MKVLKENKNVSNKNRKNSKRLNKKKLFFFFMIIIIFVFLYLKNNLDLFDYNINDIYDVSKVNNISTSKYDIIKQDSNKNYSGIGSKKVSNKDGYFSTFTTEKNYQKTYKEYKQNGSSSWANNSYWGGTMAENGCGITSMSIILSGYGKNYTPEYLRKKYYPVLDGEKISKELSSTFGIANSDFYFDSVHLSNEYILKHLKTNRPVLVCLWNKPHNNRWTTASHYMVLLATDGNNMVYVSNPNGLENDSKSSGWYDINEITPYLAKALFVEEY